MFPADTQAFSRRSFFTRGKGWRAPLVLVAAFAFAFMLAGCDEYVHITRDPDLRIPRGSTWAWRGAPRNPREVISRDVLPHRDTVTQDPNANNDVVREKVRNSIEQTMAAKGFVEIPDPQAADFLVDYHFAVQSHNVPVAAAYPGGYPGMVCGPYRCWESWGYGPPEIGYQNIHFREGTFVFDLTKHVTNQLVYRAIGAKPVGHEQITLSQGQINDMIHRLLYDLKTRK